MEGAIDALIENLALPYTLKKEQRQIIEHIVKRKNVLGILPTGYGKSDCFAFPPKVLDKVNTLTPGKTHISLVISPLRSLMLDMALRYNEIGINCVAILKRDEMTDEQIKGLKNGDYSVVLCSPEAALLQPWKNIITSWEKRLCCITVDEAHCLTTWGQDFRPAYKDIVDLRALCDTPILALTATATEPMVKQILDGLNIEMEDAEIVAILPDRPNIFLQMSRTVESGDVLSNLSWIVKDLVTKGDDSPKTIIYARGVDQVTRNLGALIEGVGSHFWVGGDESHNWQEWKCTMETLTQKNKKAS